MEHTCYNAEVCANTSAISESYHACDNDPDDDDGDDDGDDDDGHGDDHDRLFLVTRQTLQLTCNGMIQDEGKADV